MSLSSTYINAIITLLFMKHASSYQIFQIIAILTPESNDNFYIVYIT